MTAAEEDPEYPAVVGAFLTHNKIRRAPWGGIVVGGHITHTRSTSERRERAEIGETAISLLDAMGVDVSVLNELTELPWNSSPEALIAKLQEIRNRPNAPQQVP